MTNPVPPSTPPRVASRSSCLGGVLRYLGGLLLSSACGWLTGLVSSVLPRLLATVLGGETLKTLSGLLTLMLAAVPFLLSLGMALAFNLFFNRRRRATR